MIQGTVLSFVGCYTCKSFCCGEELCFRGHFLAPPAPELSVCCRCSELSGCSHSEEPCGKRVRDGRERPYPDGPHPSFRRLHLPDEPLMQWYPHLHQDKPSSILFRGRTQPFHKQQSSGLDKSQSPCSAQTTVHFPSLPLIPALALASLPRLWHPCPLDPHSRSPKPKPLDSRLPFLNPLWLIPQMPPCCLHLEEPGAWEAEREEASETDLPRRHLRLTRHDLK